MEHVLHVVVVLKLFEEFFESFALFGSHFLGVVRNSHKFAAGDFEAIVFEILLNV